MGEELILALDQGSSSSRALVLDRKGRIRARAQAKVRTYQPKAGWAEHDPEEISRTQEATLRSVLAKIPKSAAPRGIGLAVQRSTVVFWDKKTGKTAGRAPSWMDGRASAESSLLAEHQKAVHEKTGLYLTPYYSAPKIRWALDHDPAVRRLADAGSLLAGPVSSFLVWRLTRGELFACDPTTAQRTLLFNLRALSWDEDLLKLFRIPREILPEIRPSCGDWGSAKIPGRAAIPILAALGDQQAAALGLGTEEGLGLLNYGTGAFFLLNTGRDQRRVPGILTSVGPQIGRQPPTFLQEGTVHAAGSSLDWLRQLGILGGRDVDKACAASTHRVLALPAIGGLGAPRWDYVTKTAFAGLTSQTRAPDLVRGVVEGLAFLIADIALTLKSAGLSARALRAAGGLSRVSHLLQFQADLLGLPISRCGEAEATALGAASLAAQAAGLGWSFSPKADRPFRPKISSEDSARLLADWGRFVDSQARLSRELSL